MFILLEDQKALELIVQRANSFKNVGNHHIEFEFQNIDYHLFIFIDPDPEFGGPLYMLSLSKMSSIIQTIGKPGDLKLDLTNLIETINFLTIKQIHSF